MFIEIGAFIGNNETENAAVCWELLRASNTSTGVKILKIGQSAGNLDKVFGNYGCVMTNPYQKGTLGEIAVCKELLRLGLSVFVETGNTSKVDLIALDSEFRTYKIQIKATNPKNEIVSVYSTKNLFESEIQFGIHNQAS